MRNKGHVFIVTVCILVFCTSLPSYAKEGTEVIEVAIPEGEYLTEVIIPESEYMTEITKWEESNDACCFKQRYIIRGFNFSYSAMRIRSPHAIPYLFLYHVRSPNPSAFTNRLFLNNIPNMFFPPFLWRCVPFLIPPGTF